MKQLPSFFEPKTVLIFFDEMVKKIAGFLDLPPPYPFKEHPREMLDEAARDRAELEKLLAGGQIPKEQIFTYSVSFYLEYLFYLNVFEEWKKMMEIKCSEAMATLRQRFAGKNVHFDSEIFPLFDEAFKTYLFGWGCHKAALDLHCSVLPLQRRYDLAMRLLKEPQSPYSDDLKAEIQREYSLFSQLGAKKYRASRPGFVLKVGKGSFFLDGKVVSLLDKNFHKQGSKQPVWKNLQSTLFAQLREKKISETQSIRLIACLLKTFIPDIFAVTHPESTVRFTVRRSFPRTSSSMKKT